MTEEVKKRVREVVKSECEKYGNCTESSILDIEEEYRNAGREKEAEGIWEYYKEIKRFLLDEADCIGCGSKRQCWKCSHKIHPEDMYVLREDFDIMEFYAEMREFRSFDFIEKMVEFERGETNE